MRWVSNYKHPEGWTFEIESEILFDLNTKENVTFFNLLVMDANGEEIRDYLQEALDIAQDQAFEDFGVPLDSWVEAPESEEK